MAIIAITGHSAGIGKAFADRFEKDGHTIIGLSKRDGNNIRNIPKILEKIIPCDMFINNAQSGYAQAELLLRVTDCWANKGQKIIWSVSTLMTQQQELPTISGMSVFEVAEYRAQKRALEDVVQTIIPLAWNVKHCIIRPGVVATQPYNDLSNASEVNQWANTIVDIYNRSRAADIWLPNISAMHLPMETVI